MGSEKKELKLNLAYKIETQIFQDLAAKPSMPTGIYKHSSSKLHLFSKEKVLFSSNRTTNRNM